MENMYYFHCNPPMLSFPPFSNGNVSLVKMIRQLLEKVFLFQFFLAELRNLKVTNFIEAKFSPKEAIVHSDQFFFFFFFFIYLFIFFFFCGRDRFSVHYRNYFFSCLYFIPIFEALHCVFVHPLRRSLGSPT